jgi:predicted SnoaL-like aldol condensation-catalyzing enzyme
MTQSPNPSAQTGATELSQRTPEEIFAHHAQALGAEDLDATVMDYADTAYIVTPDGVMRGKDAVRNFFAGVFQALPQAQWGVRTRYVDNLLFLEWTADSRGGSVSDGVDTFIFQDGLIQAQTVRCTIVPKK